MLKKLYNILLIGVISGSLLSLQSSTAFAQAASSNVTTTDSKGLITNTKTYQFDKVSDSDMLASLGMLAAGFITGRMIASYKPLTNDVMVAGAGGVAFIAGEIMTNLKFKGTIDEMTIEVQKRSDGKINEEQIQRLEDLKKSYEEAKDTTETKKKLQLAAAVALGAAAAMAGYMAYTEFSAMRACDTAIASSLLANTTCAESKAAALTVAGAAALETGCQKCAGELTALQTSMKAIEAARVSPGPSLMENGKVKPLQANAITLNAGMCKTAGASPLAAVSKAGTACGAALKITSLNQIFAYPLPAATYQKSVNQFLYSRIDDSKQDYSQMQSYDYDHPNFLERAMSLFIPKAQAGWLPLLGLGASTAAAFFLLTEAAAIQIDMMMFVPFNRAIAFGALAGVAFLASKSSDNVIDKLDENIKKIDTILNELNKNAKGIKTQNIQQQATKPLTLGKTPTTPGSGNSTTNQKTPCMTGNSSENCKPLADQLASMPGFSTLPESFRDVASQSVKLGDNLSGSKGISGAALSGAEALGSKQKAIAGLLAKQQGQLSKISNGKADLAKGKEKFMAGLAASLKKELRSKGMTATGMMASLGTTPINSALAPKEEPMDSKPTEAAIASTAIDLPVGDEKAAGLALDFSEAPSAEMAGAGMGTASGSSPEYDIKTNEIAGDNGPSLFELISNRYIKSGYPKLLEEEPVKK